MPSKKRHYPTNRAVRSDGLIPSMLTHDHFDRVSSLTYKLRPEISKTLFVISSLVATEFRAMRTSVNLSSGEEAINQLETLKYYQNAEAALRLLRERLLGSFRLVDLIAAESIAGPQWEASASRIAPRPPLAPAHGTDAE